MSNGTKFILVVGIALSIVIKTTGSTESGHKLSREITSAISASFSFEEPAKAPPNQTEEVVLAQPERKNQIIRLPRVVVEGTRPPVFREQDIHTPKALREIALKRYVSDFGRALNAWRIPLIGGGLDAWAMARWREDERKRVMKEIGDQILFDVMVGEEERAKELQAILGGSYFRPMQHLTPGQQSTRDAKGK